MKEKDSNTSDVQALPEDPQQNGESVKKNNVCPKRIKCTEGKDSNTSDVQPLLEDSQQGGEPVKKSNVRSKRTECMEGKDSNTSNVQALPENLQHQYSETVNLHTKLTKSLPRVDEKDPENGTILAPPEEESKSGNLQALSSVPQQDPKKPKKRKQCQLQTTNMKKAQVQFTSDRDLQDFPQQESSLLSKDEHPISKKQIQSSVNTSDINFQPPPDKKLKLSDTSQIVCLKQGTCNSNTPEQLNANEYWISQLGLFKHDEAILHDKSCQWLNDNIIYAALTLLHQHASDTYGFQSPQCGKHLDFTPVPTNKKYIQILHVDESHWILISNIDVRQDTMIQNHVCIYDSLKSGCVSLKTKKQIASFTKPIYRELKLDIMNIMSQPDSSSCGLFAFACAADLVHKIDPTLSQYDAQQMRPHLRTCFEKGLITPFPITKKRRVPLGSRIWKSEQLVLVCECRMPRERKSPVILCMSCKNLFHIACVKVQDSCKDSSWICNQCKELLDMAKEY